MIKISKPVKAEVSMTFLWIDSLPLTTKKIFSNCKASRRGAGTGSPQHVLGSGTLTAALTVVAMRGRAHETLLDPRTFIEE